jgi:hypothetical protein
MPENRTRQAEAALHRLTKQFTVWRHQRRSVRGSRIPAPLWTEAIRLGQILPLRQVAHQLGLKPQALRRQSGLSSPTLPTSVRPPAPAFVEVSRGSWSAPAVEVEIHRPDGVRVQLRAHDPVVVLPVLQRLLERC